MSEIVDRNGNEIPDEGAEGKQDDGRFFFRLIANDLGVDELSFRKNGELIFATLLFALDYINQTFDVPYPTTADFIQQLKESAEKFEALQRERKAQQEAANAAQAAVSDGPPPIGEQH